MKLPEISNPQPYVGLYVIEHQGQTAVGYTADEVETLLEQDAWRTARIFRINAAYPGGRMELQGVHADQFQLESGLFFFQPTRDAATADFARLADLADQASPTRARLQLCHHEGNPAGEYCTALVYPAESDADVARWLLDAGFDGGDIVEGGISAVTQFVNTGWNVLESRQVWSRRSDRAARNREELLAAAGQPLQRKWA